MKRYFISLWNHPRTRHVCQIIKHRPLLSGVLAVCLGFILVQLLYPYNRTMPFASIDSVNVGAWKKTDAVAKLDQLSSNIKIPVRLAQKTETYTTVTPNEIGLKITNSDRVQQALYPFYLRFIPTSILWGGVTLRTQPPSYSRATAPVSSFIENKLGGCKLEAKNAEIVSRDASLHVVPAKNGGSCDPSTVQTKIEQVTPTIARPDEIRIDADITKPLITTEQAIGVKNAVLGRTKNGVTITVADTTKTIPQSTILDWLTFSQKEKTLVPSIDGKQASEYLQKKFATSVETPAGVTKITTRDFTEVSKKTGTSGQAIDTEKSIDSVRSVVNGNAKTAALHAKKIAPKVEYSRSYTHTSTGISALISQYGKDHPGTFAVAFQELGGEGRSAAYNGNKPMTTASTYKLFVAYSTLKRIDSGKWHWSDKNISGGRDLSTCFDDMIIKSDNACAEALLDKIGISTINKEIAALGLPNSGFKSDGPKTTPSELQSFLVRLQTKKLGLKSASTDRLLGVMKKQVYRSGIPSGTNGTAADKVGFLNGLLHDAAIVYSPKGDYVLVIMTDGSSWANIADLTKKIEQLR